MRLGFGFYLAFRMVDPMMQSLRSRITEFAEMNPDERVLDICCGTGSQALHYATKNINATGIDLDLRMIQLAEKRARKRGLRNVFFQSASALDLPFADNLFDYASICLALHEKNRLERDTIISEMKRVVKADGMLIFIDYHVPVSHSPLAYVARFMEFAAGKEHHRRYKDYVEYGGIGPLLKKSHLRLTKQKVLGPLILVASPNTKGSQQ